MSGRLSSNCPENPANPAEVEALYPEGTQPEDFVRKLSALCSYGLTPLVVQGALRQVLIQHFADSRNILSASLRKQLERDGAWRESNENGVLIESLHRWRPELTEARPALILKAGAWRWQRQAIGNFIGADVRSGRQTFHGVWIGSHTIFALAKEGAEAQVLAVEAMKCLTWFQGEIAQSLGMLRFSPAAIGEVSVLQESTENYVVPLSVAYVVPETWSLQPEAPRLKVISWTTEQVLQDY